MSTTVNTGWLKDKSGEKFAPKTLASQVTTNEGVTLETEINEINESIDDKLSLSGGTVDGDLNVNGMFKVGNAQFTYDTAKEALLITFN